MMGPTASGKTAVALEIARLLPCEIISVDSAQVYRHMNIGTAKPDRTTLAAVPHHLIDLIEPNESYSAARFCDDALRLMAEITARGNIPLLVGGTMLYFKALIDGLSDLPEADPAIRRNLDILAEESGWPTLHAELQRVDPVTAARLAHNDAQRIQRALEIYYISGQPMSELLKRHTKTVLPYRVIQIALLPGVRQELHRRIAQRFETMLEQGLIDELRQLRLDYELVPTMPSMRCVGYRQAWRYLDGAIDYTLLCEQAIAATRQLAKRQLTWLRAMNDMTTFDCLTDDLSSQVLAHLREHLREPQT